MINRAVLPLFVLFAAALEGQNPVVIPQPYQPITAKQRAAWFGAEALGPSSLIAAGMSAGLDTWRNDPTEYGSHWSGFGERYGYRLVNRAVSSGIEVSLGSLWGEDPRYRRAPEKSFAGRAGNVIRLTFVAHNREGHEIPAYARLIAIPSTSFLSNTWVPDSRNSAGDALYRIAVSFGTQMLSNAFAEFWPDVRRKVHGGGASANVPVTSPSKQ